MSGSVPSWSVAVQCALAGVALGLVAMQAGVLRHDRTGWRGARPPSALTATLAWSVALAGVALANGLLELVADPGWTEALLAVRMAALAASVVLGLPAIRAFTDGPSVRVLALAAGVWYTVAGVLWFTTALIHRPTYGTGLPVYGPLSATVDLVPVIGVAAYLGVAVSRRRLTARGAAMTVAGFVSAVLLVASSIPPPSEVTELLKGMWALPLVAALLALTAHRIGTERQALNARLHRAAFVDALTGLPTRAALDEHLSSELAAGLRPALLLVDIEGLKHTNERHGHAGGDRLLVHTAVHLARELGPGVFVARTGGDEFAAVLPGRMSPDELRALGRRLRECLTPPADLLVRPRLTVGVAHAACDSPVELQRHADLAMVEARSTHAGVVYFDDRLREREDGRAAVHADLERAVAEGRIIAHFQPVADTATLQVIGVEALARWQDGDTLRAPASWLPLAEETGLIVEIGEQMFAAARAASDRFGLPVAVNVAARQLDEPDVLRRIERGWGDGAWDRLTIEVTESALAHDDHHVRAVLTELASRGVRIALDDFGTGYNSLARLGTLPLHVLKIDKSLVDGATTDEGLAVLRAVVGLADAHGLEVVAEGVEQRAQLQALLGLGVGLVQGNLIGRPRVDLPERTSAAPTQRVRVQPVPRVTPA
ncbi:MAG: bifunctional diguanylate cyclase/phosphodiesterase [Actinomycetales bacterium]|nr:bifunctional diguanylate cyclase/phosphodiesterase [Actinomycetales bacterium]